MRHFLTSIIFLLVTVPLVEAEVDNNAPVISNVVAAQRTDGSNLVDISYDLADADGDACSVWILVSNDGGTAWTVPVFTLSGHSGSNITPGTGKQISWDVGTDAPGLVGSNFKVRVLADDGHHLAPMCFVPSGNFYASTGHEIYLDAYFLDAYEVTNEFYCMFLNAGGNDDHFRGGEIKRYAVTGGYTYRPTEGFEQRPVRGVTWEDAAAFCDWRSESEGLPQGSYHLPTEAQWEKAAGWDPENNKLWDYPIQSDSITNEQANISSGNTTDVASYAYTSYYGCYDMAGNVQEWCADWGNSTSYPSSYSNPTGLSSSVSGRVVCGGNCGDNSRNTVSQRDYDEPTYRNLYYGFRCARTAE